MEWWRKLRGLLSRRALDADLEEEIRAHLEMKAAAADDPAAARRQFGNATLHIEDARSQWRWGWLSAWPRDFRYALRGMRRKPGFALTVVLTLGLAIGSASTIYSLIDAVLIRPLPYPDSGRLVALFETQRGRQGGRTPVAPGRLEDWHAMSSLFAGITASARDSFTETSAAQPERVSAAIVAPRFFALMGTPPAFGRGFTAQEEQFGGSPVAVLSDAYWRRRFSADPQAVGQTLALNGQRYAIVGVMPASFRYPTPPIDVWIPRQVRPEILAMRTARFYFAVGRLKPGVTPAQAKADLDAVQQRLVALYPKTDAGWAVTVSPLEEEVVGSARGALWLLTAAVSVLLLIGCANVACLLLARLDARSAEMATRLSLGAGRSALARQLLVEGLVYAFAGGALGLAAAVSGAEFLRSRLPDIPRIAELTVDARMLALVTLTSILAALLFSLAPILQTMRRDLAPAWMRGGRGVAGSGQRLSRFLVASQFALATALLIGAGLFLRSLARIEDTPLGFRPEGVLSFHVGASFNESPAATLVRHERIMNALQAVPGVTAVAMSGGLPGASSSWPREVRLDGQPDPEGTVRFASWRMVTAAYFETLGIPLLSGRTCRMVSDRTRPFETLINRSFADTHFPGRDPIGHSISRGPLGDGQAAIVGVVADVREDGPSRAAPPIVYGCGYLRYWPDPDFLVRTRSVSNVTAAVRALEPQSAIYAMRPLTEALSASLDQTRFRTFVVTLFSTLSLVLAAIGLYGVMAYAVSQRSREIGIRLALGARRGQIVAAVVRSGAILAACGAAAGIAIGAASAKLIGTQLYGVRPYDAVSYAGAVGALFAVALLACLIPARRAVSIDPTDALRES